MWKSSRLLTGVLAILATSAALGAHTPAAAQSDAGRATVGSAKWTIVDAIGYAGLGFGLGLMAAWDQEPEAGRAIVAAAAATGLLTGGLIGHRAGSIINGGGQLNGAHRTAALAGAVMAGATLGALAAVPLINPDGEGTFLGSDEQTVMTLVLAGVVLGSVFAWRNRRELAFRNMDVMPARFGDGHYGLGVRLRF